MQDSCEKNGPRASALGPQAYAAAPLLPCAQGVVGVLACARELEETV